MNRVYDVKPLAGDEPVQLRPRQNYWIAPLEGAAQGELALVREQVRPDQTEQFVVVSEPTVRRVWIDKAEATDNFTHIHVIGAARQWGVHDLSLDHLVGVASVMTHDRADCHVTGLGDENKAR